jgi:hypothetical protein
MLELEREAAVLAGAAGPLAAVAEEQLAEPESEPLLADPRGTLQEETRRQRSTGHHRGEAATQRVVTEERD